MTASIPPRIAYTAITQASNTNNDTSRSGAQMEQSRRKGDLYAGLAGTITDVPSGWEIVYLGTCDLID